MWIVVAAAAIVALLVIVLAVVRRRRGGRDSLRNNPLSIVVLLGSPRRISEAEVTRAYEDIYKVRPTVTRPNTPDGMHGFLYFVAAIGEGAASGPPLGIIDCHAPYVTPDDLEHSLSRIEHPLVREAVAKHRAWLGVDAMGVDGAMKLEDRMNYQALLAMMLALNGDKFMLIYLPREGRFGPPGRKGIDWLIESIRAGSFKDEPGDDLNAPMYQVSAKDADVRKAMAAAQTRLPEFCDAWERLGDSYLGMVKAKYDIPTGTGAEYIWVKVKEIKSSGFVGTIENHPIHSSIPKKGSQVTISIDRVVDWAYVENDQPVGLFVEKVLVDKH